MESTSYTVFFYLLVFLLLFSICQFWPLTEFSWVESLDLVKTNLVYHLTALSALTLISCCANELKAIGSLSYAGKVNTLDLPALFTCNGFGPVLVRAWWSTLVENKQRPADVEFQKYLCWFSFAQLCLENYARGGDALCMRAVCSITNQTGKILYTGEVAQLSFEEDSCYPWYVSNAQFKTFSAR